LTVNIKFYYFYISALFFKVKAEYPVLSVFVVFVGLKTFKRMRNLSVYFKSTVSAILNLIFFIPTFYLSMIFFLVLLLNEAIAGKVNEGLKEDFMYFIKRISEFPETLFPNQEKKEMDLSGKLS
jgi:hypothetical protein